MIQKIDLDGKHIEYDLKRKDVKNINLRIRADATITVSASARVPITVIESFIRANSKQILRAVARYEEILKNLPQAKEYKDGEIFRVFGNDLILKVTQGIPNSVTLDEKYIVVTVKDLPDRALTEKLLDKFLKELCRKTVTELCENIYPSFEQYNIPFPTIRFRTMVSRWGSCHTKKGILTFNYSLVESPISCIEYVVAHEFVHFLHPDHSSRFYNHLATIIPDWKERKNILNGRAKI